MTTSHSELRIVRELNERTRLGLLAHAMLGERGIDD